MPRAHPGRLAKHTSQVGLLVLVAGAPLAIGCVHPPAILAAAGLSAITFLAMLWRRRVTGRRVRVPALGWVLLGLTGYVAFQCVPLPAALLKLVAPASHRLFEDTLGVLGLYGPGSFRPISLDPPATLWEALKMAVVTAVFLLGSNVEERGGRRAALLLALGGAGVLMVFVGIAQVTAGTNKIFGIFQPWSTGRPSGVVFTTFVNANHGAAFLGVAAAAWVGLAARTPDLAKRLLCILGAILCAAGVFLAVSRGGIVAFAVGQLALYGLLLGGRAPEEAEPSTRFRQIRSLRLLAPLVLAACVGVGLWLAWEPVTAKFATLDAQRELEAGRPKVWRDALPLLADHALVGTGRGAFAFAYTRYQTGDGWTFYSHLENEYLQLPVDLGIPVGVAVFLCIGLATFGWLTRGGRSPVEAAALAALLGLAVHAFTDFNLETLGVAIPAAALAGMLAAYTPAGELSAGRVPRRATVGLAVVLPALLVTLGALCATPLGRWAEHDAEAVHKARREPLDAFVRKARAAVRRHPADYLLYAATGTHLAAMRDPEAMKWLNRAMLLHPRHPGPHVVAARALRAAGRHDQALVEYRAALALRGPQSVLPEVLAAYPRTEDLLRAMPERAEAYHELVAALRAAGRHQQAFEAALAGHGRWPKEPSLVADLVEIALERKDTAAAEAWARRLQALDGRPATFVLVGRALDAAGRADELLAHFEQAVRRHPQDPEVLAGLAGAQARVGRFEEARRTAERMVQVPNVTPAVVARMHEQLAAIDEADGRPHRAQWHRRQASRLRGGP